MTQPPKPPRVGFVSLGCPRNQVDSEVMLGKLQAAGFGRTHRAEEAEVIVVNTCGFIDAAKRETIDTLLEMASHKQDGACRKLVVTGCMAQRYGEDLRAAVPEIDALIGVGELDRIVDACRLDAADTPPRVAKLPAYLPDPDTPRVLTTPRGSAYLKVSEGCDHQCSFCVIPQIRGPMRSLPIPVLVQEAASLAQGGVRELNLIGQDSSAYGRDLGDGSSLGSLLRAISRVEGISWIRLLYVYPVGLEDDVLEAMAASERICRYIDVPLQHADRWILKRMLRGGDSESLLRFLERLRTKVPGITLRSTFIVGFPGEKESHFRTLLEFLRSARLDRVGAFTYSHEESTSAYSLPDDCPPELKRERLDQLMSLQREISLSLQEPLVGSRRRVLVDGRNIGPEGRLRGRTARQAPDIDGCVWLRGGTAPIGSFVNAEIESADPYDLHGRIVEEEDKGSLARMV